MYEYRTLGRIDLSRADGLKGDPSSLLAQAKPLALFTYLLLARPAGMHRRDELVAMFWPNSTHKRSRAALSQALHVIRRTLDSDVLEARGYEEIGIAPRRIDCDALLFRESMADGRLEPAMSLYEGELMPAFFISDSPAFERWLDRERAEIAKVAASAAWTLADEAESARNSVAAGRWGRRAVAIAPYDEASIRRVMELLARLGDRAGALQVYGRFEAVARSELGLQPSVATKELAGRIRGTGGAPTVVAGRIGIETNLAAPTDTGTASPFEPDDGRNNQVRRRVAAVLVTLGIGVLAALVARPGHGPVAAHSEVERPTIAVMPIGTMGESPHERAEIMTAKMIESLTRAGFTVPSYEAVKELGASSSSEAWRRAGIRWVVEGDLVAEKGVSELSIRIVDPELDRVVWARPYREGGRSTMDFMLSVAQETADTLAAYLGIEAGTLRVPRLTSDPIADSLYTRAVYERPQNFTLPGLRHASDLLRRAIERDPMFAPAFVELANTLNEMSRVFWDPPPEQQMPEVGRLLATALELDPSSPRLHTQLGWYAYTWEWDWEKAESHYQEALRLDPNSADTNLRYAFLLVATGRTEEGLERTRTAARLDPLSPMTVTTHCWLLYLASRFDEALDACRYVVTNIDPTKLVAKESGAQRLIAVFAAPAGRRAEIARSIPLTNMDTDVNYEHSAAMWAAIGGDTTRALALIVSDKRTPGVRPFRIANAYAWAGQLDSAFVWLDRAIEARDPYLPEIGVRPVMEPYRADPRYAAVLRRLHLDERESTHSTM